VKVLVLGATGETGLQLLTQARERGHDITVLVRHPERLGTGAAGLRVLTGDVTRDQRALAAAVRGQNAVVSALGVGKSLKSGGLIARAVPAILNAMQSEGVRRLVFTSAYGVGETWRDVPPLPRILIRLLLRDLYSDKRAGEAILRDSDLDWTLVYPTTLTNGHRTGRCQVGERLALRGIPKISRADLADFLLSQLDDHRFVRTGVLISNA
jgi:putative NADH-flavin reductase